MNRAWIAQRALVLAAGWIAACGCDRDPANQALEAAWRPPNVVLIVLDTTRADSIGALGPGPAYTPTLDRLAREGVIFTRARSTAAWTLPAHASLFTGLYTPQHGAHHESQRLAAQQTTLAEVLSATHRTAAFSENPHISPAKGFDQGFGEFQETWRAGPDSFARYSTVESIGAWLRGVRLDRPLFLFVNLMTAHLPYRPPPGPQERFVPAWASSSDVARMRDVAETEARQYMMGRHPFTERDFEILRALYRGDVAELDSQVQQILDLLRVHGLLEHALVIIVGDHGENIGDHGLMEHQFCLYESLLHVPLILWMPGGIAASGPDDAPVQLVDVMPTVLDAVRVAPGLRPPMQGQSLWTSRPPTGRPVIAHEMRPLMQKLRFAEIDPDFDFSPFDRRLQSIQVGQFKLIVSDRNEVELYDLEADPSERDNIALKHPDVAASLNRQMAEWLASAPAAPPVDPPVLDEQTREKLRSLGYAR